MNIEEHIAKRIVSSIYSWYALEKGYSYLFLNNHSLPSYFIKKQTSKLYHVIRFDATQFSSQEGRNILNSILIALKTNDLSLSKTFKKFIVYDKIVSTSKAIEPLLNELGMTVPEFESLFNTETDFTHGNGVTERKYKKWRLVFERNTKDIEDIIILLNKVDLFLGKFSEFLSYGIVEIKRNMPPKILADYNPKNDSLRIKSNCDSTMLHEVLHELAHRLWFRRMSRWQRRMVKTRYGKMLHEGGGLLWAGEDVFPSEYSKTSVEEFFAECFAFWRAGELCKSLSKFMESLFMKRDE